MSRPSTDTFHSASSIPPPEGSTAPLAPKHGRSHSSFASASSGNQYSVQGNPRSSSLTAHTSLSAAGRPSFDLSRSSPQALSASTSLPNASLLAAGRPSFDIPKDLPSKGGHSRSASDVPAVGRHQRSTSIVSRTTIATSHSRGTLATTASRLRDVSVPYLTTAELQERSDALRAAGVRRLPLTQLSASPELTRLRPILRAHMPDLEYLSECAAQQYPRAANGKDLALVLRVSAILRNLSQDGVREVNSLPWHMAQMFGAVSPPTAFSTIYDFSPTIADAQRLLGLEMITPPSPTIGLGLRVEFLSPHRTPTPVPVPADNGDIIAARTGIRSFAVSRGVLPGLTTSLESTWFPWLLTHVYASTASPAVCELDAFASLRMASRLVTRLYAGARRSRDHVPIPPVMSRCYALTALGSTWTLYCAVLEGDLVVTEIATVNASDPIALMHMLGLVRIIASEAEERRHIVENWLYCLTTPELSSSSGMASSASASASSDASMPVTPKSPSVEALPPRPEAFASPRPAPKIPTTPTHIPSKTTEGSQSEQKPGVDQSQAGAQRPRIPSQKRVPVPSGAPVPIAITAQQVKEAYAKQAKPGAVALAHIPPALESDKEKRLVEVPLPKQRSPVLDISAWRAAVGGRPKTPRTHKSAKSVG